MPFALPDHVLVTPETLQAVAARHQLSIDSIVRLPEAGIFNAVYRIGQQAILRVPRNHPTFIASAQTEAVAAPAARAAGARTPDLLAFDATCTLLPVPYTVYGLVPGVNLESCEKDPADVTATWREYGRDLARIHLGVPVQGEIARLSVKTLGDPRRYLQERSEQGWLSPLDARWFGNWLDRIAPAALTPVPTRFLHADTQATNVMVDPVSLRYLAVIDWGSAALGDVACDFAGVPLRAAPALLAGYRAVATPDGDHTIEARIVWRHLELALKMLPRGAVPGRSWAERPWPTLLETLRFFIEPPDGRWRSVGP